MVIYILGLLGVAVFAISGALAAGKKHFDWVGVIVLATVTSIGGGTIRDVLLNKPVFWVQDPTYLWVIGATAFMTMVYTRFFKVSKSALLYADALGMALFAILGARLTESLGYSHTIIITMGVLTGAAGGVIRDVLVNEIPILFQSAEALYSVAAMVGIMAYLLIGSMGLDPDYAAIIGILVITVLRISAIIWHIKLPEFQYKDE